MTSTGSFNSISSDDGMGPIGVSMQDMGAQVAMFGSTNVGFDNNMGLDTGVHATADIA